MRLRWKNLRHPKRTFFFGAVIFLLVAISSRTYDHFRDDIRFNFSDSYVSLGMYNYKLEMMITEEDDAPEILFDPFYYFYRAGPSGTGKPTFEIYAIPIPFLIAPFLLFAFLDLRRAWKPQPRDHAVCPQCDYNLTGCRSVTCPECGGDVADLISN